MVDESWNFWFANNKGIIYVSLIALIILIFLSLLNHFVSGKIGKSKEKEEDLEATLRRVLETANLKTTNVAAVSEESSGKDTGETKEPSKEALELQEKLNEKAAEIEKLKKEIESKASSTGEDKSKEEITSLTEKLGDLEKKLSEYEIIEDDIANLSLYKEENLKLKQEIEKLKGGSGEETEEPEQETVAEVEEESAEEEIIEEAKEEVAEESPNEEIAEEEPSIEEQARMIAEEAAAANSGDAAKQETAADAPKSNEEEIVEVSEEVTEPLEVAEEASVEEEVTSQDDDIMAEFVAAVSNDESVEVSASVKEEKIAEELVTKEEVPSSEDKVEEKLEVSSEPDPLAEETDTDKLLNEMGDLMSADAEDVEKDEGDPSEKLISEFEEITKEG